MSGQAVESFWINIIAGIVLLAGVALVKWAYSRLARQNPRRRTYALAATTFCWLVLNTLYVHIAPTPSAPFVFVSCVALAWIGWSELRQFWRIGLVGADAQIRVGIDFKQALSLVSNSMDFLGIGAAKMTAERAAFEDAIARCQRPDRPVRFLLCRPDNERLLQMARSAGPDHDRHSYQKRVQSSLATIADLRNSRAWNIQVRFYRDFPIFRLMFIDDSICLASHYVLGKGAGAELPQLHIVRVTGSRDIDSLYYAFNSYFERFWEDGEPWDFGSYLDSI
jgi:hypothetical protein